WWVASKSSLPIGNNKLRSSWRISVRGKLEHGLRPAPESLGLGVSASPLFVGSSRQRKIQKFWPEHNCCWAAWHPRDEPKGNVAVYLAGPLGIYYPVHWHEPQEG